MPPTAHPIPWEEVPLKIGGGGSGASAIDGAPTMLRAAPVAQHVFTATTIEPSAPPLQYVDLYTPFGNPIASHFPQQQLYQQQQQHYQQHVPMVISEQPQGAQYVETKLHGPPSGGWYRGGPTSRFDLDGHSSLLPAPASEDVPASEDSGSTLLVSSAEPALIDCEMMCDLDPRSHDYADVTAEGEFRGFPDLTCAKGHASPVSCLSHALIEGEAHECNCRHAFATTGYDRPVWAHDCHRRTVAYESY